MRILKYAKLLALCLCVVSLEAEAKEKILFIPIDDRPVCMSYTVNTIKAAGWDIETPPKEYIASFNRTGDPDKLYKWLEDNALLATDAVVSSDSLIYGGLVPSRTHTLDKKTLETRTKRLIDFKKKFDCLRFYVYGTVMRSPRASSAPVEPAYYGEYGPKIFKMGELKDKQEIGVIKKKEKKELETLIKEIPQDVQEDLYTRRKANLSVTEELLKGVEDNAFDYFLLGRDDTAEFSDAHRDARKLQTLTQSLPDYKIRFFAGADQLGLVLLNRAINKIEQRTPVVYTFYNEGRGGESVPSYEDDKIKNTIKEHILAAGGYPARSDKRSDLVLAVNTPIKGVYLSSTDPKNTDSLTKAHKRFLNKVENYVKEGKNVGIADVSYGNGSDNALVKGLFSTTFKDDFKMPKRAGLGPVVREHKLAWTLGSYAGWNTASNTLGYTLGQGMLRPYLTEEQKNDLLAVRYLDEWVYEANVRQLVRKDLIWPNKWKDGALTPEQKAKAEADVTTNMRAFASNYFVISELNKWNYSLPWSRMFEVEIWKK